MAAKFFALLTAQGAAKLSNMAALGEKLEITSLAFGDGGGKSPTPSQAQTALVNEVRRAQLNSLSVDDKNDSQIIAEQIIPESVGGWWIREIGLFDADGILIAVANCPETYKATTEEGSGRTQVIRMMLTVSSTDAVTLKVDPSVVLATRQYVDSAVIEVKTYTDNAIKKHVDTANPHSQYLLIENALKELIKAGLVGEAIKNLGLDKTVQLAADALPASGGRVTGDVIVEGIISAVGHEMIVEKESGFSGIHIKNKSSENGSACGLDFSFGGAIMSSIICGIMGNGANYIDFALSPSGEISDRRVNAFTMNADVKKLIFQNDWGIQGYVKNTDFTQVMADAGWVRFPNGIILQWCWGNTDGGGWASAPFPIGWPVRCFGILPCNVAGDAAASAIAGVKRLSDRDMQVSLLERTGVAASKPFFCFGVGC